MKQVKVLIPFHRKETDTDCVPNDIIEVSEQELARIRGVNVNMVLVLEEVETTEEDTEGKKEKSKRKRAEK